ncbi:MAG: TlpA family protein disulfide reductase [Ferruginibacter sp.]|nr:TlpA family protein disulfide reductase [Chitinophagaceae bacterium]
MINRKIIFIAFISLFFFRAAMAQPRQGQLAIEIALPSVSGDTVHLSSLKGKIVLLDFWASWCGPCRVANRGLTKIYEKFRGKGFEIYSVSLDNEKDDWMKAIKKDKISWLQVIDPGGWETPTASKWGIYALPTTYLIDREGRLIAMDLEGKDLEKALKELIDK